MRITSKGQVTDPSGSARAGRTYAGHWMSPSRSRAARSAWSRRPLVPSGRRGARSSSPADEAKRDFGMSTHEVLALMRGLADDELPPTITLSISNVIIDVLSETRVAACRGGAGGGCLPGRDRLQSEHMRRSRRFRHHGGAGRAAWAGRVPPPGASVRSWVRRRTRVHRLSPARRRQNLAVARFLHRRPAAVAGLRLLTRDARRYASYFPRVELVAPDAV